MGWPLTILFLALLFIVPLIGGVCLFYLYPIWRREQELKREEQEYQNERRR